jgi:hypothetical protein
MLLSTALTTDSGSRPCRRADRRVGIGFEAGGFSIDFDRTDRVAGVSPPLQVETFPFKRVGRRGCRAEFCDKGVRERDPHN